MGIGAVGAETFDSGASWHRWEPHIHAQGTVLNDQFQGADPWDDYLTVLESRTPTPIRSLSRRPAPMRRAISRPLPIRPEDSSARKFAVQSATSWKAVTRRFASARGDCGSDWTADLAGALTPAPGGDAIPRHHDGGASGEGRVWPEHHSAWQIGDVTLGGPSR